MTDIFQAIEAWPISKQIAEGAWYFPGAEVIHVMAISMVVGSILLLDWRLINFRGNELSVQSLSREILPWTWGAFAVALASGSIMFISAAAKYADNPFFQVKLLLIAAAGINMLIFHVFIYRSVGSWDDADRTPRAAHIAGLLSMLFWTGVIVCGRWIGFA